MPRLKRSYLRRLDAEHRALARTMMEAYTDLMIRVGRWESVDPNAPQKPPARPAASNNHVMMSPDRLLALIQS